MVRSPTPTPRLPIDAAPPPAYSPDKAVTNGLANRWSKPINQLILLPSWLELQRWDDYGKISVSNGCPISGHMTSRWPEAAQVLSTALTADR